MRSLATSLALLICLCSAALAGGPKYPPPPQVTADCAAGQSVTGYPFAGAPIGSGGHCGNGVATGVINSSTVGTLGELSGTTTITGIVPGGDVSFTSPNFTVTGINGVGLGSTTATSGHVLVASGTQWVSVAVGGDLSAVANGTFTIGSGAVTSGKMAAGAAQGNIANGSLTNAQLANSTIVLGSTTLTLGGTTTSVSGLTLSSPTLTTPAFSGTATGSFSFGGVVTFSGGAALATLTNAPLLGTDLAGNLRAITLGTGLSLSGTTLNASGGGGGGFNPPASGTLIISNGTISPSGLAPINNDLLVGAGGSWTTLTSSANGVLVTDGSSVPSISSTLPSGLTIPGYLTGNQTITLGGDASGSGTTSITVTNNKLNGVAYPATPGTNTVPVVTSSNQVTYETAANLATISGFGTMLEQNASSVAITGGAITGMPTPSAAADVATKGYVDATATSLVVHTQANEATAAALSGSPTYSNGSSGVGATLTAASATTLTVDGVSVSNNDRVLVKNQASGLQNGVYVATISGSPWVLTRATDFNTAAAGNIAAGAYFFVSAGTTNAATGWQMNTTGTITVGTTALTFVQFLSNTAYTADGSTLQLVGSQFSEKTNGTTNTQLAQAGANTMKGNWTGSTANEADNSMPSCSDSGGNHLNYVSGTGITCGTSTGVSVTSGTANVVVSPSPGTGTFTVSGTGPINDQHSGGYAILTGDNTKTILTGNFTYTLSQAGTTGFLTGWKTCLLNVAASGNSTVNATTSTFNGASGTTTLSLAPGDWACPNSDGTNYDTMVGHYTGGGAATDTVTTGIAAAGTTLAGATSLTTQQNYVATGANCTTYNPSASQSGCAGQAAVKVASALMVAGQHVYITNEDPADAVLVYPDTTGHTINNQAAGLGIAVQANQTMLLIVKSATALRTVP